jgi:RNA polymerase sigma factor (sigma-70 family)
MADPEQTQPPSGQGQWFTTTHWTVVLGAKSEDAPRAAKALSELCQTYWKPIHDYIRRRVRNPTDAEDLTQEFFGRFLEKEQYRLAQRERGRFRSFLLTTVKNFLINEWERASAQKRGGGLVAVSLDEQLEGEERPRVEPANEETAEKIYERTWALTLLQIVRTRLAADYAAEGKAERFAELEKFLPGEESESTYAEAATRLGVAEGTIKSDMHRLKRRYRDLLRTEIANTVTTPGEVDDELRYLMTALSQSPGR